MPIWSVVVVVTTLGCDHFNTGRVRSSMTSALTLWPATNRYYRIDAIKELTEQSLIIIE